MGYFFFDFGADALSSFDYLLTHTLVLRRLGMQHPRLDVLAFNQNDG